MGLLILLNAPQACQVPGSMVGIKPSCPRSWLVTVATAPICAVLGSVKYS